MGINAASLTGSTLFFSSRGDDWPLFCSYKLKQKSHTEVEYVQQNHEIKEQGGLSPVIGMSQRKGPAQEIGKWDWPRKMASDRKKGEW